MDGHLHLVLFADGQNGVQEILQVGPQGFLVHGLVHLEQLLDVGQALGLPPGEQVPLGAGLHGGEQLFRVHLVNLPLVVGQHRGAVLAGLGQLGAGPVEHGHKVVANQVDAALAQGADGLDVVFDVLVPAGQPGLDGVVDIDAFNAQHLQAGVLHRAL